jgi:carboxylesterase
MGLSTTLHYDGWAVPWYRRLLPLAHVLPFAGRIAVAEKQPFGVKDERMRAWIKRQMDELGLSQAGASVLTVRELLQAHRLIQMARRSLSRIDAPTLLIHAREDEAASPGSAFEAASKIRSRSVRTVLLADSYHMISIDREKQRVLAEMTDFLASERVCTAAASTSGSPESSNLFRLDSLRIQGA